MIMRRHWRGGSFGGILNQIVVGMFKSEFPWLKTLLSNSTQTRKKVCKGGGLQHGKKMRF